MQKSWIFAELSIIECNLHFFACMLRDHKYRQVEYSSCKSNLYLAPGILKVQRLFLEQTEALE